MLFLCLIFIVTKVQAHDSRGTRYKPTGIFNKTSAPLVTDDIGDGYRVGSLWLDTTNDNYYVLLDHTAGAAIWGCITTTTSAIDFLLQENGDFLLQENADKLIIEP